MMPDLANSDYQPWKDRWASLDATLNNLITCYQAESFPRRQTILSLLRRLKLFGQNQFGFFANGFSKNGQPQLAPSAKFPPEHVLNVILDQIAFDIDVLTRAADQRMGRKSAAENMLDVCTSRQLLDTADRLAMNALSPVIGAEGLITNDKTTVLTYLQKSANIRVIPYAPVAIIGVPFTAKSMMRDFLAIPHEVGHYVYRHGRAHGKYIFQAMLAELAKGSLPEYVQNWREEIFADVYGCLMGGPVMGLDFQDLQFEKSSEDFIKDKGTHPVPMIRPYLYNHVLTNSGFNTAVEKLASHWEGQLQKRGNPAGFKNATSGSNVTLETAQNRLSDMVTAVNSVLDLPALTPKINRWSDDLEQTDSVQKLYQQFNSAKINTLTATESVDEFSEPAPPADLWQQWVAEYNFFPATNDPRAMVDIREGRPEPKDKNTWLNLFVATGWATRGPRASWG